MTVECTCLWVVEEHKPAIAVADEDCGYHSRVHDPHGEVTC